jgi:hypothetical protein
MKEILLLAYPVLNAILNRWPRGTYSWGPWVTGAILAGLIFLITSNYYAAGAFFVLYGAGESFGWGKWLASIPYWKNKSFTQEMYNSGAIQASGIPLLERKDGKNNGVHLLANLIAKETENFRSYAWWALFFRGILWHAPYYIALSLLGVINVFMMPIAIIILAFGFPIIYSLSFKIFGDKYWTMGELSYGLLQGIVMAVALYTGVYHGN